MFQLQSQPIFNCFFLRGQQQQKFSKWNIPPIKKREHFLTDKKEIKIVGCLNAGFLIGDKVGLPSQMV